MSIPVAGQIIKGKYRVDRVLGEGGMGIVVAGHHVALDQRVAIKFVQSSMLAHPEILARFSREARAASKIESDHVARVMDVDTLDDGTPFMVMEYLEGVDLSTVRAGGQPLPAPVAVSYLLEACEAIAEAHRLGIVHRDLKPANLFLARRADGRVRIKVLDFGISKMSAPGSAEASVTQTSAMMGSAEYMSPEQMVSAKDVDGRADIWALGVTLYELVTARVPFPGETITHVAALVMSEVPVAPSLLAPDLPPGLDAVIFRCLEKRREQRYASVAELVAALRPFARGERDDAALVGIAATLASGPLPLLPAPDLAATVSAPGVSNSAPMVSTASRPRSKLLYALAAAALLGLGGAAWLVLHSSNSTEATNLPGVSAAAPPPASPGTVSAGPMVTPASSSAAPAASSAVPEALQIGDLPSAGSSPRNPARKGTDAPPAKRAAPTPTPAAAPVAPPKPDVHKID